MLVTTDKFFNGWMPFLSPNQQCEKHRRKLKALIPTWLRDVLFP